MSVYTNSISFTKHKKSVFSLLLTVYFCVMVLDVFKIGGAGTLLKYYAVLLIVSALVTLRKTAIILDKLFFFEALYLYLCFGTMLYSINLSASLSIFISIALNFALIMLCGLVPCSQAEVKMLERSLLLGSALVLIATFVFSDFSDGGRMTISILADTTDPNYLNGYILFAFGFSAYRVVSFGKHKLLNGAFCITALYFTLMTGSRGALLAEVAMFLLLIIINAIQTKKKLKYIIIISIVSLFCLCLFDYLLSMLPQDVAERFSAEFIQEEGTSTRSEIWAALLSRFFSDNFISILFGHGIGTSAFYNTFDDHVAHNAFIDVLIGSGIIGLSVYIAIFVLSLKKAWKSENYFMVAVLGGFIVMSMSLSLITYKPIFNAILYIEIYYREYVRRIKNETRIITSGSRKANGNNGYYS